MVYYTCLSEICGYYTCLSESCGYYTCLQSAIPPAATKITPGITYLYSIYTRKWARQVWPAAAAAVGDYGKWA